MIYLLTAIGLSPSGSSTVHIYTQTVRRTIQNKQYIKQHNNFRRVRAVIGDLRFYINFVHLLINVCDCVSTFISCGAQANV